MKKGFTLIELLVVILIIGILAAVALPQYKYAVKKTKYAELQLITKRLAESANNYYLTHNEAPHYWDDLDVDLDNMGCSVSKVERYFIYCKRYECDLMGNTDENIICYNDTRDMAYVQYFAPENQKRQCWAAIDNEMSNRLCMDLGGSFLREESSSIMPSGSKNIYNLF